MDRVAMAELISWKNSANRKPLVMRGARQVGKTWLLKEFGRSHYSNVAYLNCQRDPSVAALFSGTLDPERMIRGIAAVVGESITPGKTLLLIDEIQDAPGALTALKYFSEERPDLHVAAAGSLLGVAIRSHASFPVGMVNFVDLHPMSFSEFLRGVNRRALADLLEDLDWQTMAAISGEIEDLLRLYLYVGGMPEAVGRFAEDEDLTAVRKIQGEILRGYANDFSKYATATEGRRIAEVWESMPAQLARENKRFLLGKVRKSARARDFEEAIRWLEDAGLVHRVTRLRKPAAPLRSYEDRHIFKLYLHDVGLLGALSSLHASAVVGGMGVFEEFKGALTEQYVLQQIIAVRNETPMYWSPDSSTAEVDFASEMPLGIVPMEVKAAENLRSKSLRSYIDRYGPPLALRFSLSGYREEADLSNVPLYAVEAFLRELGHGS